MRFTRWMVVAGVLLAGRAGVAQDDAASGSGTSDGTPGPTELSKGSAGQGKTESIVVTVQSVEQDKITVTDAKNQSHEFAVDDSTRYVQAGKSITKDELKEGDRVRAVFVEQDDGTLQASAFQLVRSGGGQAVTGTGAGDAAADTGATGDTGMGTGVTGDTGMGTGATGDTGMGTGVTGDTGMGTGATSDTGMGTGVTGDTGMGTGATGDTGMGTGTTGDTSTETGAGDAGPGSPGQSGSGSAGTSTGTTGTGGVGADDEAGSAGASGTGTE